MSGVVQVVLRVRADVARALRASEGGIHAIVEAARGRLVKVDDSFFVVELDDAAAGAALAERLRAEDGVEAAFVKPPAALP